MLLLEVVAGWDWVCRYWLSQALECVEIGKQNW